MRDGKAVNVVESFASENPTDETDYVEVQCYESTSASDHLKTLRLARNEISVEIRPGDSLRWEGGDVYWTPVSRDVVDVQIRRLLRLSPAWERAFKAASIVHMVFPPSADAEAVFNLNQDAVATR
jgi:hypothetical protein